MAQIPMSPLGGFNSMLDSVEFVKKAWSSFNLPSQFAPTMDLDEIDKRIHDLRAVEQWLNLNVSMLRTTIQGLELQRSAISAVGAMSEAMKSGAASAPTTASTSASASSPAPASATAAAPAAGESLMNPGAWWNLLQSQFAQIAQAAIAAPGPAGQSVPSASVPVSGNPSGRSADGKPKSKTTASRPARKRPSSAGST